jgi:hypothetical protein
MTVLHHGAAKEKTARRSRESAPLSRIDARYLVE